MIINSKMGHGLTREQVERIERCSRDSHSSNDYNVVYDSTKPLQIHKDIFMDLIGGDLIRLYATLRDGKDFFIEKYNFIRAYILKDK